MHNWPKEQLGEFVNVKNFEGCNGPVRNQFLITTSKGLVFQSYDTIIAALIDGYTLLDKDSWDYSATTGKYRNRFLGESKRETVRQIKAEKYILCKLN